MHATAEFALTRADFLRLQRVMAARLRGRARRGLLQLAAKAVLWLFIASAMSAVVVPPRRRAVPGRLRPARGRPARRVIGPVRPSSS